VGQRGAKLSAHALPVKIRHWPLARLKPYARNARTHTEDQVRQVAESIRQFGFTNPILVDTKDGILAGHCRLRAADYLSLAKVPVIVLDHLSEAQKRAYILADNKLALNAGWNEQLLAEELVTLDPEDLATVGFSDDELADLFGTNASKPAPEPQIDRAAELGKKWKTAPGQLWAIGSHRLLCGDSTVEAKDWSDKYTDVDAPER